MALPARARDRAFDQLKRDGIKLYNVQESGLAKPKYECERSAAGRTAEELAVCGRCSGFFSKKYFHKHKANCRSEGAVQLQPTNIPAEVFLIPRNIDQSFKVEILSKFIRDKVGQLCSSEPTLVSFGERMYMKAKAKKDKKTEVKRSVMCDMRRLGMLFVRFLEECQQQNLVETSSPVGVKDMIRRKYYQALEPAVRTVTTAEKEEIKSGLKVSLYYLLKRLAKVVKSTHLVSGDDDDAAEVDKFVDVLDLNKNYLFGDAVYKIRQNRETRLRRPEAMPDDDDIELLRSYTVGRMSTLLQDPYKQWSTHEFVELRDLADCRLTLFNARRGGEPARLMLSNWEDAKNDAWLHKDRLSHMAEEEKSFFSQMKVMYQSGKGNHLVPFLVPADTIAALDKLCDSETRAQSGVADSNRYLFPSTHQSPDHIYGWYAVNRVAQCAGVRDVKLITATKMRHRVSTIYASLDVPMNQRQNFYRHMGHSADINASIYQAPLAELEVTQVGRVLQQIDQGHGFQQSSSCRIASSSSPAAPADLAR